MRSQTMLILWTVMGAVAGYTSARMYKLFKVRTLASLMPASIRVPMSADGVFRCHILICCL